MDFDDLAARLRRPLGGFTVRLDGSHVTDGFAVSVRKDLEWVVEAPVLCTDLEFYVWHVLAEVGPGSAIGGWHEPDTGWVYLDVSLLVDTEEEAQRLARTHGQLAYYDFANCRSVTTPD